MTFHRTFVFFALVAALIAGLSLAPAPATATGIGNHDVTYVGYVNDFPSAGQSTWFYTVTSGSGPAISHVTFALGACLTAVPLPAGAGTWSGSLPTPTLNPGAGSPVYGADPTTGVTGVKFDLGFSGGQTRNYYFTVTGALGEGTTLVALKAGSGFVTGNVGGPSCDPLDPPLSVLLTDFEATVQPDHVLVSWRTISEANNQGFNLYRSTSADDLGELLGYVPSSAPGSTQGAAYQWQDANITYGVTYFYTLQDIDLAGVTTLHGPVSATPQAPTAVTLSSLNADGDTASAPLGLAVATLSLILMAGFVLARWRGASRTA
jgi:hypothetical protein